MKMKTKLTISVVLFYSLLYFILSFTALNLNYVEGDDAGTILFHLMGREEAIQPPYSSYHGGIDFLLSFLPPNEPILRITSIWISYIAGFLGLCLMFIWIYRFTNLSLKTKFLIGLIIPFMIPELIFQSLLLNPTNIGFVFCLLALICLEYYLESKKSAFLLFIPLLMLFGVPFRWPLLMFFATLTSIYLYRREDLKFQIRKLDLKILGILTLSVVTSILGIWLTGYNLQDIGEAFFWGKNYISDKEPSLSTYFAMGLSFLTPTLVITTIIGLISKSFSRLRKFIVILIATLPFFILGFGTSLKYMITLLPIILLFAAFGIDYLMRSNRIVAYGFIGITILPWIIGVKVFTDQFAYGPGFEINQWQSPYRALDSKELASKNPDSRLSGNMSTELTASAGFYLPTPEGPRPFYGYASCLFGGKWSEVIQNDAEERKELLKKMTKEDINVILQARRHTRLQSMLFAEGYSSVMPYEALNDRFVFRDFSKSGKIIRLVVPNNKSDLKSVIDALAQDEDKFGVYLTYSSEATFLQGYSGVTRLGPYTLIRL